MYYFSFRIGKIISCFSKKTPSRWLTWLQRCDIDSEKLQALHQRELLMNIIALGKFFCTGSEIKPIVTFANAMPHCAILIRGMKKGIQRKMENHRIHGFFSLSPRVPIRKSGISEFRVASVRMCPGDPRKSRSRMDTRPGNGRCDNLVCTVGVYLNFIGGLAVTWVMWP